MEKLPVEKVEPLKKQKLSEEYKPDIKGKIIAYTVGMILFVIYIILSR